MDDRFLPFLQKHSDFHNIFYDKDFELIRKKVKELSDVLKNMTLRFDRHETLNIATSVYDYVTQKEMYIHYPHMYYDFRFGDTRICIGKVHKHGALHYFVNVCGFKPSPILNKYISEYGYGDGDSVESVFSVFCEIIRDFILTKLEALF